MKEVELFLDSGAFSAWNQGVTIRVEDYISFVKKYRKSISLYAVLDVIGDAEGTWRNQKIMEDAGLCPLPCFHFGEPLKYLERYVREYDYIAIGGLAKKGARPEMFEFLDRCFDVICDDKGMPQTRVHGFAVTSLKAMRRYPWYSVDSTTWLLVSRMGSILVPYKLSSGEWDYLETLPGRTTRKVAVSTISPISGVPDMHISTVSSQWQAEVSEWLEAHDTRLGRSRFKRVKPGYQLQENERWAKAPGVGELEEAEEFANTPGKVVKEYVEIIEEPGVSNDYVERDIINAKYFKELEAHFPKWPWAWKRPALRGFGF